MSSRFVSSGRIDTQTGDAVPSSENLAPPPPALSQTSQTTTARPSAAAAPPPPAAAPAGPTSSSSSLASTPYPPDARRGQAPAQQHQHHQQQHQHAVVDSPHNPRSEEWAAVQSQVDASRRLQTIARESEAGQDTRSLFEVLQANKAAKQAAFEEANRIKNQFRPLDEDEAAYLEEVRARKRAEERRVRLEEEEGLEVFRRARRGGEDGGRGGGTGKVDGEGRERDGGEGVEGDEEEDEGEQEMGDEVSNAVGASAPAAGMHFAKKRNRKKREEQGKNSDDALRRRHETLLKAVKKKMPTENESAGKKAQEPAAPLSAARDGKTDQANKVSTAAAPATSDAKPKPKLGLVDYGSDDDDDE